MAAAVERGGGSRQLRKIPKTHRMAVLPAAAQRARQIGSIARRREIYLSLFILAVCF